MKIQKKLDWLLVFYISHIREYMPVMEELLKTIEQCRMGDHNQVWVIAEKVQANSDLSKATFALNVSRLEVSDDKSFLKTFQILIGQAGKKYLPIYIGRLIANGEYYSPGLTVPDLVFIHR
jgi:hypothetical protein